MYNLISRLRSIRPASFGEKEKNYLKKVKRIGINTFIGDARSSMVLRTKEQKVYVTKTSSISEIVKIRIIFKRV